MTKREMEIQKLEALCEKNAAAIEVQQLTLKLMQAKQVNRLAELRFQKLLAQADAKRAAEAITAETKK